MGVLILGAFALDAYKLFTLGLRAYNHFAYVSKPNKCKCLECVINDNIDNKIGYIRVRTL